MGLYVIGSGRLGRDPEVKYSQNGVAILSCSVACYVGQKRNKDGSYGGTEWVEFTLFGKPAESAANVMRKGLLIEFNGYQQTDEYNDQQGQPKKRQKVIINSWGPLEAVNPQQQQPQQQQPGFGGQPQQGFQQQQPQQQQQPGFGGGFNPNQPQGFQQPQTQPAPQAPQQQPGFGGGFNPNQPQGFQQQNQPQQQQPQGFGGQPNFNSAANPPVPPPMGDDVPF